MSEVLPLLPILLAELVVLAVAVAILWCLTAGAVRRRRARVEAFAADREAIEEAEAAADAGAEDWAPGFESDDPLVRLEAEYAAEGWERFGSAFCVVEMVTTRHGYQGAIRCCMTCLHESIIGGAGE